MDLAIFYGRFGDIVHSLFLVLKLPWLSDIIRLTVPDEGKSRKKCIGLIKLRTFRFYLLTRITNGEDQHGGRR